MFKKLSDIMLPIAILIAVSALCIVSYAVLFDKKELTATPISATNDRWECECDCGTKDVCPDDKILVCVRNGERSIVEICECLSIDAAIDLVDVGKYTDGGSL